MEIDLNTTDLLYFAAIKKYIFILRPKNYDIRNKFGANEGKISGKTVKCR
jgi:hypothetical protein